MVSLLEWGYKRTMAPTVGRPPHSLSQPSYWRKQAATLWVTLWRSPHCKKLLCLWPTDSENMMFWVYQPMRNLPTAMWGVSVLGRRFFPIQPRSKWLQARPKPWFQPCQRPCITGTQLSHAWIPNPQALSDNKCVLFWPAKLGDNLLHNNW